MVFSRIDRVILGRVGVRVAVTVLVFFSLIALAESLNTTRFSIMQAAGGLPLAILATAVPAARWLIGTLPITVLIGTVAAVLDLQVRHELTIMKVAGLSIWRVLRWPVIVLTLIAGAASILGETWAVTMDRSFPETGRGADKSLWMEQMAGTEPYILRAEKTTTAAPQLRDVTIFMTRSDGRERIVADSATYQRGKWLLKNGTVLRADAPPQDFAEYEVATRMTSGDLALQLSVARDQTFGELVAVAGDDIGDPELRAISLTSLYRAFTLPFMVAGSVLLAFALAGSYRRRGDYGNAVLLGLILGFVLFVVSELATRAGNSQALPPLAATAGPALLSLLAGATALLFREDGKL